MPSDPLGSICLHLFSVGTTSAGHYFYILFVDLFVNVGPKDQSHAIKGKPLLTEPSPQVLSNPSVTFYDTWLIKSNKDRQVGSSKSFWFQITICFQRAGYSLLCLMSMLPLPAASLHSASGPENIQPELILPHPGNSLHTRSLFSPSRSSATL